MRNGPKVSPTQPFSNRDCVHPHFIVVGQGTSGVGPTKLRLLSGYLNVT
jgi:hypothetical protein